MAKLGSTGFDHTKVKGDDLIADGEYAARIVESDITATKSGDGKILLLVFEVTEGAEKGRRHWERLNIQNPNSMAQSIAQRQLKSICEAVGAPVPLMDSEQLHHKPLRVRFGHKPGENGYGPKNVIKSVAAYNGSTAAPASSGTAKPAANGGGEAMPWD